MDLQIFEQTGIGNSGHWEGFSAFTWSKSIEIGASVFESLGYLKNMQNASSFLGIKSSAYTKL